jgi:3-phenylpropionate/trans-cinnamate dioxygenase ferredoxin subunit
VVAGDTVLSTFVRVCRLSDLGPDTPLRAVIDGTPVMVVLDTSGDTHAVADTCTHAEISLSEGFIEGYTVECWAHGARFNLRTGASCACPQPNRFPSTNAASRAAMCWSARAGRSG